VFVQRAALAQDRVGDRGLADVVQLGGERDALRLVIGEPEPRRGLRARSAMSALPGSESRSLSTVSSRSVLWRPTVERPALCSYMRWSVRTSASAEVLASPGRRAMP